MNMQTAIKKCTEAIEAWGPAPTEAECEAARARYKANPSAGRLTREELAADAARSDRLAAADHAALAAAGAAPCGSVEDALAAINFVVGEGAGELDEAAGAILSRCADFLRSAAYPRERAAHAV